MTGKQAAAYAKELRTREGFQNFVVSEFENLIELFKQKNDQYGDIDPLANFKMGASLSFGTDSPEAMYETLKGYVNKHVAHVFGHNIQGVKACESWGDIAVYAVLAKYFSELYYAEHMQDIEDNTNEKG